MAALLIGHSLACHNRYSARTDSHMPIVSVGIHSRGGVAVCRLANPVTLCDGHGVFFAAASEQIRATQELATRVEANSEWHVSGQLANGQVGTHKRRPDQKRPTLPYVLGRTPHAKSETIRPSKLAPTLSAPAWERERRVAAEHRVVPG